MLGVFWPCWIDTNYLRWHNGHDSYGPGAFREKMVLAASGHLGNELSFPDAEFSKT